jgi:hypothetical protein
MVNRLLSVATVGTCAQCRARSEPSTTMYALTGPACRAILPSVGCRYLRAPE